MFLETKVENIKIKTSYLYPEADSLITDSVKLLLVFIHYLENYILVLISFFSLIHFLMKKKSPNSVTHVSQYLFIIYRNDS